MVANSGFGVTVFEVGVSVSGVITAAVATDGVDGAVVYATVGNCSVSIIGNMVGMEIALVGADTADGADAIVSVGVAVAVAMTTLVDLCSLFCKMATGDDVLGDGATDDSAEAVEDGDKDGASEAVTVGGDAVNTEEISLLAEEG